MGQVKCSDRVDFDPGDQIDRETDQRIEETRDFKAFNFIDEKLKILKKCPQYGRHFCCWINPLVRTPMDLPRSVS
jgi:hypothetical protein